MKQYRNLSLFVFLLVLGSACASQRLATTAVGEAAPEEGWDGVNNLFRDGSLYFGGQPDSAAFERLANEANIQTVVSFRRPQEHEQLNFDESALLDDLGVRFVNIPVSPDSFSKEDVDRLAEVLGETKGPVLLHCGSSNRVGGVWATYLVQHRGFAVEEAIRLGQAAGLKSESMIDAVRRVTSEEP